MQNDIFVYQMNEESEYELVGIVYEYSSLIWHEKLKEPGSFELQCPKTSINFRFLKPENIIQLENHTQGKAHQSGLVRAAIITEVSISDEENDMKVTGRMLDYLLTWRNTPDTPRTGTGTYGNALFQLIDAGARATIPGSRWLKTQADYAAIGSDAGTPTFAYGELYTAAQSFVSVENNVYFEIGFDPANASPFVYNIFAGRDLSATVEFSTTLANLEAFNYTSGIADYKNVAKIAGEKIDETSAPYTSVLLGNRVIDYWPIEGEQAQGWQRRELFVDVSDVKSSDYFPIATEDIYKTTVTASGIVVETDEIAVKAGDPIPFEYQTPQQRATVWGNVALALRQRGAEALAEHQKTETVDFEIVDFGQYEYMIDWDLGDVVLVSDDEKGISLAVAVTEVQEVFDSDGYKVVPVFGTPAPSLQRMIRRDKQWR